MITFFILILISAVLAIFADYYFHPAVWIFKPLTMILVIASAYIYGEKKSLYTRMILAGLIFSLFGDVFLIVPQKFFLYGLVSFLIAHIFYTIAFFKMRKRRFNAVSLVSFVFGILIFLTIRNDIPESLLIPVIIYTTVISTMLCFALNLYLTKKNPQTIFALAGAFLFVVSDSFLAINKFSYQFPLAKFTILSTYFAAQWLIARSAQRTIAEY